MQQQSTEEEQIVSEHLMLIQAGAQALVAARRAVARHHRTTAAAPSSAGQPPSSGDREQLRQQANDNRVRAQQNRNLSRQHRNEALLARWAAAEAAREHAAHIADAWSERLREAGVDPGDIKNAADAIEASADPEAAAEHAGSPGGDLVAEQLAAEFADQQLVETATAAAAAALSEQDPAAEHDPDAGKPLTERLRGLVPDHKIDNSKQWHRDLADEAFKSWVQQGMNPADLIEAARQGTDMHNATLLMNGLGKAFIEQHGTGSTFEPDPGAYQGEKLSELLRGIVPDTVLDAQTFGNWDGADATFEHWLGQGMSPSDLVEIARHSVTPKGAAAALNEAGEEFTKRQARETNRIIAASQVNAGRGNDRSQSSTPAQPPQPAPAPTLDVEMEL